MLCCCCCSICCLYVVYIVGPLAEKGDLLLFQHLLKETDIVSGQKRDINAGNQLNEHSPLLLAIDGNHHDLCMFLVSQKEYNVNVGTSSVKGEQRIGCHETTPLHAAAMKGNIQLIQMLLERKDCDASLLDENGRTALENTKDAVKNGRKELVNIVKILENDWRKDEKKIRRKSQKM